MIGKVPLCNKKKERAPHIGSFCFFLCWRCTGVTIGGVTAIILFHNEIFPRNTATLIICFLGIVPAFVDGTVQKYTNYLSTNPKRLITGLLLGLCAVHLFLQAIWYIQINI